MESARFSSVSLAIESQQDPTQRGGLKSPNSVEIVYASDNPRRSLGMKNINEVAAFWWKFIVEVSSILSLIVVICGYKKIQEELENSKKENVEMAGSLKTAQDKLQTAQNKIDNAIKSLQASSIN